MTSEVDRKQKKSSHKPGAAGAVSGARALFVDYELTEEQRAACKALVFGWEQLDAALFSLCDDGYKLTVRQDSYSGGYAAWLIAGDENPDNAGFILSGRGSTPLKAVKQLLYKHEVVFNRVWTGRATRGGKIEIDD